MHSIRRETARARDLWRALQRLERGPCSVADLALCVGRPKATVARWLAALRAGGWPVDCTRDEHHAQRALWSAQRRIIP